MGGPDAGATPQEPEPAPPPYCAVDIDRLRTVHDALTPRQRMGQHLVVGLAAAVDREPDPQSMHRLESWAPGGAYIQPPSAVVFEDPVATARFVHRAVRISYELSGVPLLVAIDQEGGPNSMINTLTGGTDTLSAMAIGATGDPEIAAELFALTARELRVLGIRASFGPVLDVAINTRNGNLNTRAFGPDPELVATLGVAAMRAMQRELVLPFIKHFPGDGLMSGNTHKEEITVEHDREYLERTILRPFRAALEAGADGLMTIPERYAAIDPDRSAITSRTLHEDLLRKDMGFEGLVITDALGMRGVGIGISPDDHRGFEALVAGADLLLYATVDDAVVEDLFGRIETALGDGTIDPAAFEASTLRILEAKQRYCLLEEPPPETAPPAEQILAGLRRQADLERASKAARASVVLVESDGETLPLTGRAVLYAGPTEVYQDPGSGWLNISDQTLGEAMRAFDPSVEELLHPLPAPSSAAARVVEAAAKHEVLVLATLQARYSAQQQRLVEGVLATSPVPVVHVSLGVPFDHYRTRGRVAAAVAALGNRSVSLEAAAALLYGDLEPTGALPYDLNEGAFDPVETPGAADPQSGDRCAAQEIDCAGQGTCIDTSETFGCACYPNYHPSEDGLDCVPDG